MIKPGVVTAEMLRRFDRETQVLGRLQHPGIARVAPDRVEAFVMAARGQFSGAARKSIEHRDLVSAL